MRWLKASYRFHTYCYRDPRAAFASTVGVPVVSPTTVLLSIASTLFRLGMKQEADDFLKSTDKVQIKVDAPEAVIFFRAFQQARRYETDKYDMNNPRLGLTKINQATKEYGLVQDNMTLYVRIDEHFEPAVRIGLENLTHLGTKDSLCSLADEVQQTEAPNSVIYHPSTEVLSPMELVNGYRMITIVTLSRFKSIPTPAIHNWYISGRKNDTELVPFIIPGRYLGTTRGKIYQKQLTQ